MRTAGAIRQLHLAAVRVPTVARRLRPSTRGARQGPPCEVALSLRPQIHCAVISRDAAHRAFHDAGAEAANVALAYVAAVGSPPPAEDLLDADAEDARADTRRPLSHAAHSAILPRHAIAIG